MLAAGAHSSSRHDPMVHGDGVGNGKACMSGHFQTYSRVVTRQYSHVLYSGTQAHLVLAAGRTAAAGMIPWCMEMVLAMA